MQTVKSIPIINDSSTADVECDTVDEFTQLDADERLSSLFDVLIEIDNDINDDAKKEIIYENI